jgi:probable HAF family extracellular repeat protein
MLSADGHFTNLDFPGATYTSAIGINPRGDIAGGYTLADNVNHGFLLSGGEFTTFDFPGASATIVNGMNARGDIVGGYTISGANRAFALRDGQFSAIDYPNAAFTTATGINSRGDVVGRYRDAAGVNHGFLLVRGQFTTLDFPSATYTGATSITPTGDTVGRHMIAGVSHGFLLSRHERHMGRYTITDLGPLPGGTYSYAASISENHLIAGTASPADGTNHAALWGRDQGLMADVSAPGLGGLNSAASGVNESAQIAGEAGTSDVDPNGEDFCGFQALGLPYKGNTCAAFVWQNGVMNKLPTLGGPNGSGSQVNNRGDVAGYAEKTTRDPACGSPQKFQFRPVLWSNGVANELPVFPGDLEGIAVGVNDSGQVAGGSGVCANFSVTGQVYIQPLHALLWQNGETVDLGNLGGSGLFGGGHTANSVNNLGWVVGSSDLPGDADTTTSHAFLWTRETGMRDLPPLPHDVLSVALGINDAGQVTGLSIDGTFSVLSAVLWQDGAVYNLNDLVTPGADAGLYLQLAQSINSLGEIVGFAQTADGDVHGYLATPDVSGVGETTLSAAKVTSTPRALSERARKLAQRRLHMGRAGIRLSGKR